jgi:hypothetical protein
VIASPLRPRHRQESGIAAASRLAHRGTPYGASLSFATTTHLWPLPDPPSREPTDAYGRRQAARSIPSRALASSMLDSPCQGSRTGLTPPISTSMPSTLDPLRPTGFATRRPACRTTTAQQTTRTYTATSSVHGGATASVHADTPAVREQAAPELRPIRLRAGPTRLHVAAPRCRHLPCVHADSAGMCGLTNPATEVNIPAAWQADDSEAARLGRANEALRRENGVLRAELRRQWGYNHAEFCDIGWPHPSGEDCSWPPPDCLARSENRTC